MILVLIPASLFAWLVTAALALSALAPLVLLGLLVRDWLRGTLW